VETAASVAYLNIIEEEVRISKVEHHLLHPESQLYHGVGVLDRNSRHTAF
jgi:hypothetical protein